jgi:hypothetical protein
MASWGIVENTNARYIVVYSLSHNISQKDIAFWTNQSDAVIVEQGTKVLDSETPFDAVHKSREAIVNLLQVLETQNPKPIFATDVSPKMRRQYFETGLRLFSNAAFGLDAILTGASMNRDLTRREFLKKGTRILADFLALATINPILQSLVLNRSGERGVTGEAMRKSLAHNQEFVLPIHSSDVRDAISALKWDILASELQTELKRKPTILIYDFRPNHAMLQDFLRAPGKALLYLRDKNLDLHVMTEEIPKALRFDFNGKTWDLTTKTLELPELKRPIRLPKTKPRKEPEFSRRELFRRIVRR